MGILGRLQRLVEDSLFWRVTVCLFGLPFAVVGVAGVIALSPPEGWWWLSVLLLVALAIYGVFLVYAACLGSDDLFERATRYVHEGGDVLGLVFVMVVGLLAVPITVLLRWFRPKSS